MVSKTLKAVDETAEVVEKQASKAAKVSMDVMEEVLDDIEETLDTIERIPKLALNGTTKKQQVIILTTVAVVAAAAGGVGTYFVMKKRLAKHYEDIATAEIAEARERYTIARKDGYESPEAAVAALIDEEAVATTQTMAEELGYKAPDQDAENVVTVKADSNGADVDIETGEDQAVTVHNVFVDNAPLEADEWDFDVELVKRAEDPTVPYIIEHDEFMNAESGYEQTSLTYFKDDGVLVDSADQPISDTQATVGDDNLTRFGHGSRDANILYVRNDKSQVDFEIALSHGSYTEEVLGLDHVIKHSARQSGGSPRRFRPDRSD